MNFGGSPHNFGAPSPIFGAPQATEVAKEEVKRVLGVLDGHLKTRTFLVGERVSLADISLVCALLWLYKQVRGHLWGFGVIYGVLGGFGVIYGSWGCHCPFSGAGPCVPVWFLGSLGHLGCPRCVLGCPRGI